ncbi:hypothetical protein ACPYO6_05165 [Georgenia sp. Z1344]|uniref:hypothetical protein n=1 Tax=Georgenia sp. Z1344 TaxID=3416706 RepID=UPI003CF8A542
MSTTTNDDVATGGPKDGKPAAGLPDRLRRRRRMLAWSAPLLGIALTAGPFLIGVSLADDGHRSTAEEDPAGAIDGYAALADDTRFGPRPWIAVYNTGTSALMADQAATAVTELTEALELVPEGTEGDDGEVDPELPECLVRRNLSLSYELLASEALADEDRPMVEEHLTDALEALGPCTTDPPEDEQSESPSESGSDDPSESPSESGSDDPSESPSESESDDPSDGGEESDEPSEGEEESQDPGDEGEESQEPGEQGNPNDEIQRRQDESREENREAQRQEEEGSSGDEEESSSGEGGEGEEESSSLSPQEQELQDRNREAQEDQRQQEQREGGGYGGGQNW